MLQSLVAQLGPWSWWMLGLILLAAELVAPGVFLIWIGAAALTIGLLSLAVWDSLWWGWQVQLILFAVLSVLFALAGRKYMFRNDSTTDEPMLNRREASLVGRTATLSEPIAEGRGRIRIDDTWWPVSGPNLPSGTQVRVTGVGHASQRGLTVEAVEA